VFLTKLLSVFSHENFQKFIFFVVCFVFMIYIFLQTCGFPKLQYCKFTICSSVIQQFWFYEATKLHNHDFNNLQLRKSTIFQIGDFASMQSYDLIILEVRFKIKIWWFCKFTNLRLWNFENLSCYHFSIHFSNLQFTLQFCIPAILAKW